jgi:hypothetical protein
VIVTFTKRIGNKIWSGWLYAWNAFDNLVYWYVIGEKRKPASAGNETRVQGFQGSTRPAGSTALRNAGTRAPAATPSTQLGLDFTPVTQHLQALSQKTSCRNGGASEIRLVMEVAATVPKDLQYPESNEDAYAWDESGQRAAVFDGATESFAAERWVASTRTHWLSGHPQWLQRAREEYDRDIKELNLSWAQLEAAERGSYTTLVSIESIPLGLRVTTIGDSCIFLLEDTEIIACDPYVSQGEFFASPQALSTRSQDNHAVTGEGVDITGDKYLISPDVLAGKQLLLATDALSQWLMVPKPQGRLTRLLAALKKGDLKTLVTQERATGELKTDDTTALLLTVTSGARS